MSYAVKEIFYTLQGEGAQTGRAAVFCRFAGCNLWSGREADRASAICQFCDTDFADTNGPGGGKFDSAGALADAVAQKWPGAAASGKQFVVCTGGEPLLQLDAALIGALHARGFEIAVETNGTIRGSAGIELALRQPQGRRRAPPAQRRRAQARLSASRLSIPPTSRPSPSAISSCSPWTAPAATPTRKPRCAIASTIPSGA